MFDSEVMNIRDFNAVTRYDLKTEETGIGSYQVMAECRNGDYVEYATYLELLNKYEELVQSVKDLANANN